MSGTGRRRTALNIFITLLGTTSAISKYADAHLYRTARLSVTKFRVLRRLAARGETMTASEIARLTNTEKHNITTLIRRMKRDGLVTVKTNEKDRRSVLIGLTDRGREALAQARPAAWEVVDRTMASVADDDFACLQRVVSILRKNITAASGRPVGDDEAAQGTDGTK